MYIYNVKLTYTVYNYINSDIDEICFLKRYIIVLLTWAAYCLVLLSTALTSICHPVGAWSCFCGMFSLPLTMDLVAHYLSNLPLHHGLLCREVTFTYSITSFHLISWWFLMVHTIFILRKPLRNM